MPKYLIERELAGAGNLSKKQLKEIAQTSCEVLYNMGPGIQWVQSYVTENKMYCLYNAPNADVIMEHASYSGMPANKVNEVKVTIDPITAE